MANGGLRRLLTRAIVALPLACLACGSSSTHGASADASTTPLVPEAGFTDVPPLPDGGYAARMFYVFQPADEDAAHKPLFVLFNGSPHVAMEVGLLAYGTGRATLDRSATATAPTANAARWTRFGNLLYLDSRDSGFSYYLGAREAGAGDPDAAAPALYLTQPQDAADFIRALLAFLDSHPPLRASPVVLVGESEGGIRATWMLDLLLRYATETADVEDDLRARIQAHYDLVFPGRAGSIVDEATAATQFGTQVLIEPLVVGCQCVPFTDTRCTAAVDGGDPDDTTQLQISAAAAWSEPDAARALVGVDLASIPLLLPAARADAFRTPPDPGQTASTAPVNSALSERFGALPQPWDRYFDREHPEVDSAQPGLGPQDLNPFDDSFPSKFIENLRSVRTFITDAYCDDRVYSPGIPTALTQLQPGLHVVVDTTPRAGVARPGWFRVTFPSGADAGPTQTVEVRFPPYATSGHMVSAFQPAELAADVQDWLAGK